MQMSSGLGATAMGIGVSHGTGGESVTGGCRLRAQNQGQASGSTMQHSNPQQSSQQQQQQSQQQQQQQAPASQQQSQQQQRQTAGIMGRSKKDNCCLCWCCCCSCSWYYRSSLLVPCTSVRLIPRKIDGDAKSEQQFSFLTFILIIERLFTMEIFCIIFSRIPEYLHKRLLFLFSNRIANEKYRLRIYGALINGYGLSEMGQRDDVQGVTLDCE